jgi:hypothetical protein
MIIMYMHSVMDLCLLDWGVRLTLGLCHTKNLNPIGHLRVSMYTHVHIALSIQHVAVVETYLELVTMVILELAEGIFLFLRAIFP